MQTLKTKIFTEREFLDPLLSRLRALQISRPRNGWVKKMRQLLGMSGKALSKRTGIDESTLSRLEDNEARDTITLKSLRKLADALECDLVYAFVPREPMEKMLRTRAEAVLAAEEKKAERSMALEQQSGGRVSSLRRDIMKAKLISDLDKRLWE